MIFVVIVIIQIFQFGWFFCVEVWFDNKGKGVWIVVMVLGFIFVWLVGFVFFFYMIWSKCMFSKFCFMICGCCCMYIMILIGNFVFDFYCDEMICCLEDEQKSFEEFLQCLCEVKDKFEFDQFMDECEKKV